MTSDAGRLAQLANALITTGVPSPPACLAVNMPTRACHLPERLALWWRNVLPTDRLSTSRYHWRLKLGADGYRGERCYSLVPVPAAAEPNALRNFCLSLPSAGSQHTSH